MSNQSDLAKSAAGFNGDPLSIDTANNRVGIGTSSPNATLDVSDSTLSTIRSTSGSYHLTAYQYATPFAYLLTNGQLEIGTSGSNILGLKTNNTERMRIDSAGRVTMPYQPAFRAYLTNNTSKASGTSLVSGTFATNYNVGGHYSTSTKRFTAPVAGLYLFTGTVATEGGQGSFNYLSCEFWVNGSREFIGGWQGNNSPSYSKSASSIVLSLSANDYVELACETNKTFNMQGGSASYTYMSGYLLG